MLSSHWPTSIFCVKYCHDQMRWDVEGTFFCVAFSYLTEPFTHTGYTGVIISTHKKYNTNKKHMCIHI